VRVTCHQVNTPFSEWTKKNYRVKRIRVRSDLIVVGLKSMAFMDGNNAILKE
jgi:hypothetical protein